MKNVMKSVIVLFVMFLCATNVSYSAQKEVLPMHKHDLVNIAYVNKGTFTVALEDNKEITFQECNVLPELVGTYNSAICKHIMEQI